MLETDDDIKGISILNNNSNLGIAQTKALERCFRAVLNNRGKFVLFVCRCLFAKRLLSEFGCQHYLCKSYW